MIVLQAILIITALVIGAIVIICAIKMIEDLQEYLLYKKPEKCNFTSRRISTSNIYYMLEKRRFRLPKRRTPLQKEIREEERTIKELKRQKADIERLAALKRKREALFEEVGDKPEKYVIAFVDGVRIPPTFANERKAIEHIGKYYPKAIEIEWKEVVGL